MCCGPPTHIEPTRSSDCGTGSGSTCLLAIAIGGRRACKQWGSTRLSMNSILSHWASSARDCPALDRVWMAAVGCGVVVLEGRWAHPGWTRPTDPGTWVDLGVWAAVSVLESELDYPSRGIALVYALMRSYTRGCRLVPWEEIVDFAIDWHLSPDEQRRYAEYDIDERSSEHRLLRSACHFMQDTGVFVTSDEGLTLTPFGDVFVTAWLKYREQTSD